MPQSDNNNYRALVGTSLFAAVALLPFSILHFAHGDWFGTAVNGGLNLLLAAAALVIWRRREDPEFVRQSGHALVVVANVAALLMMFDGGGPTAYWLYPIVFANFYLLPLAAGAILSIAFVGLGLMAVAPSVPGDYFIRLLVTTPLCIFFGVIFSHGLTRQRQQLQHLASHDALTGVGNRHGLEKGLGDAISRRERYEERCSAIIFDIDEFKDINDSIGHMRGDDVIVELAMLVSDRIRIVDRLYRFGGEEFVLLLPHAGERASWQLAEALRMEVEEHRFREIGSITISAGVAELEPGDSPESWLKRADDALYRAKAAGRNRVVLARSTEQADSTRAARPFPDRAATSPDQGRHDDGPPVMERAIAR